MGSKTAPSYNRKVPCECGRGERSATAKACITCRGESQRGKAKPGAGRKLLAHEKSDYDDSLSKRMLSVSLRAPHAG